MSYSGVLSLGDPRLEPIQLKKLQKNTTIGINILICYLLSSLSASFPSRSFSIDSMNELVASSFCFLLTINIIINQCQFFFPLKKMIETVLTTNLVDTRLWKTKHPWKRFQNFRQSCM